ERQRAAAPDPEGAIDHVHRVRAPGLARGDPALMHDGLALRCHADRGRLLVVVVLVGRLVDACRREGCEQHEEGERTTAHERGSTGWHADGLSNRRAPGQASDSAARPARRDARVPGGAKHTTARDAAVTIFLRGSTYMRWEAPGMPHDVRLRMPPAGAAGGR